MNALNEETEGNIITVYPVSGGNGANYIAVNLAYALREKDPYKKIAIVDFDFANPYMATSMTTDDVHGLDNLIDKINGNFLNEEMFEENMIHLKEDIHLLKGTKMGRFNLVKQEHLKQITDHLRALYDVVFIATSHSATDGGTAVGLYSADHLLVVGRYNSKNAVLAQKAMEAIQTYSSTSDVALVYNYYTNQNGIDFSEVFGQWSTLGTIPYLPDTVDNQDVGGKGLSPIRRKKNASQEVYEQILDAFVG